MSFEATMQDGAEACYTYRHYDAEGRLLYVGIARDTQRRAMQHATASPWWGLVTPYL